MFALDDETRWILGRPNFTLIRMSHRLRQLGHDIPKKAEDEQAACIYWMLCMYEQHGENWRAEVEKYLTQHVETALENVPDKATHSSPT
jgi:hypothetical protein